MGIAVAFSEESRADLATESFCVGKPRVRRFAVDLRERTLSASMQTMPSTAAENALNTEQSEAWQFPDSSSCTEMGDGRQFDGTIP